MTASGGMVASRAAASAAEPAARNPRLIRLVPTVLFAGFLLLPVFTTLTGQDHLTSLATRIMIMAIAAIGLDLILGGLRKAGLPE